jgi:hypothetical protein
MVYYFLFKGINLPLPSPLLKKVKYLRYFLGFSGTTGFNWVLSTVTIKRFPTISLIIPSIKLRHYYYSKARLGSFFYFLWWLKKYPYFLVFFSLNNGIVNNLLYRGPYESQRVVEVNLRLVTKYLALNRVFSFHNSPPLNFFSIKTSTLPIYFYYSLVLFYLL